VDSGKLRRAGMVVFVVVTLAIHGLVNFYIFRRGWQSLSGFPVFRLVLAILFAGSFLAYPLGRIVLGVFKAAWSEVLVRFGSYHLALMLYLFMGVLLVDIFRLANAVVPFFPRFLTADPRRSGLVAFVVVFGISAGTVAVGAANAARPRIKDLEVAIDKSAGGRGDLTVVMVSDIHLGTTVRSRRLERIVEKINSLGPEIVLLAGDIVDESMPAREEEKLMAAFRDIDSPLGLVGVPGNHEFYSGLERNLACLRKFGIRVLEDEAVVVGGFLVIAGRKDLSALPRRAERMSIARILDRSGVDTGLPLILLDHQPFRLEEAESAGVDLQLSGHTHAGQLFPLNLLNKRMYEQYWGYLRKGQTHYYVSSGVSTWGPPVRTGSVPEIVRIRLVFRGGEHGRGGVRE
jgi:predicted MPP superfamily phosphohydrolase